VRRTTLALQVFLSILGVALSTVLMVGVFAHRALSTAFDRYLTSLPSGVGGPGRMMGRRMLGSAEQVFVESVDQSVVAAGAIAVAVAAAVAILLAAYLARPIRRLETAARELTAGDLAHRVDVDGPAEVAALGEAFNAMAGSLEEAEELRRRLVADVAHELRNPLAAARAQAEGMVDGVIAADPARLDSLVEDLAHLSALIDDLQELAVAEAGRLRYEMATVELAVLARREAERARALLASGVTLRIEVGEEPAIVSGDERRLAQVLRNLLSNAARHTREGSIAVEVESGSEGVTVRVVDTGEGIAPGDLEHVFERFYRADAARAADTGGAGLGLAISRTIVRDHGGDVFARSEPGRGTTVGFKLPLA
jgi:signal transduction histidine kinase